MAGPIVTLIAAVSADGFISKGRGVPWDLPEDRAHFRSYTAGKWLLLGRTTYEEMLGWFRDHTPLVLTRDREYKPPVGQRVSTVCEAIDLAAAAGQQELVVCGGQVAFALAMSYASRLIITRVADSLGSGVPFPDIHEDDWVIMRTEPHDGAPSFCIEHYERRPEGEAK